MRNYKIKRACQYVYEYITSTTGKYQEILTLPLLYNFINDTPVS